MSWFGRRAGRLRTTGRPPSANGASSFHLFWETPDTCRSVSVTFEVLEPPTVPRLYFWALQAGFVGGARRFGAAHLGLQWHPGHPGATAVNWGGYREGSGELPGTASVLPSATGNVNTRDLAWEPRRPYRLTIQPGSAPGRWAGVVEDLVAGRSVVVRELDAGGDRLVGPIVWSEVFARCDDPGVTVRWSDPGAIALDGSEQSPRHARVNYQSHADGGCANTDVRGDAVGLLQVTATDRVTPTGAVVPWPSTADL